MKKTYFLCGCAMALAVLGRGGAVEAAALMSADSAKAILIVMAVVLFCAIVAVKLYDDYQRVKILADKRMKELEEENARRMGEAEPDKGAAAKSPAAAVQAAALHGAAEVSAELIPEAAEKKDEKTEPEDKNNS